MRASSDKRGRALDLRRRDGRAVGEFDPELFREIGHRGEIDHALPIHPPRELSTAKRRVPQLDDQALKFGREETEEIDRPHGVRIARRSAAGFPPKLCSARG
jgi:hypothetical protein